DHTPVLHSFVFSAEAFPVFYRAEYLGAEKSVTFRFESTVINSFRFLYFSMGPFPDLFRRCKFYPYCIKVFRILRFLKKGINIFYQPNSSLFFFFSSSSTSSPRLWSSFINTWKDSGTPGSSIGSPFTMASYIRDLPLMSSLFTVRNSCSVCAAPYASNAHTSISPSRWPPNWALPPRGCCVTREYGPIELACILSATR